MVSRCGFSICDGLPHLRSASSASSRTTPRASSTGSSMMTIFDLLPHTSRLGDPSVDCQVPPGATDEEEVAARRVERDVHVLRVAGDQPRLLGVRRSVHQHARAAAAAASAHPRRRSRPRRARRGRARHRDAPARCVPARVLRVRLDEGQRRLRRRLAKVPQRHVLHPVAPREHTRLAGRVPRHARQRRRRLPRALLGARVVQREAELRRARRRRPQEGGGNGNGEEEVRYATHAVLLCQKRYRFCLYINIQKILNSFQIKK